jgi:hypothetical protein
LTKDEIEEIHKPIPQEESKEIIEKENKWLNYKG